jgi:hypothetical protein
MSSASYDAKQEEDVEDDMNFEGLSLDDAGPGDDDFSALVDWHWILMNQMMTA